MNEVNLLKRPEAERRQLFSDVADEAENAARTRRRDTAGDVLHGVVQMPLRAADPRLEMILDPLTVIGEQYRIVRAKLSLLKRERDITSVLITSTAASEGKTLSACGLSGLLAQEANGRILLIDADLRKPDAHEQLGALNKESRSLVRVLRGEIELEDALIKFAGSEFYFLAAGPTPQNPSELLSSENLEKALKRAKELFDWVVIDSPPVLPIADTSLIAPQCDAAVLVIRANSTPAKLIKSAIQLVGKERCCGVLLNRVSSPPSSPNYYHNLSKNSSKAKI
jgi:capsular exopolysaccharide synthesis family protein